MYKFRITYRQKHIGIPRPLANLMYNLSSYPKESTAEVFATDEYDAREQFYKIHNGYLYEIVKVENLDSPELGSCLFILLKTLGVVLIGWIAYRILETTDKETMSSLLRVSDWIGIFF